MNLGFTAVLDVYDDLLDLRIFGTPHLPFQIRSTQPTCLSYVTFLEKKRDTRQLLWYIY